MFFILNKNFAQSDSVISNNYNVEYLNYLKPNYTLTNFEILNTGLPCVPIYNGIYTAGAGWLMEPTGKYLISAICKTTTDNSVYTIQSTKDSMFLLRKYPKIEKKDPLKLIDIPYGYYNLVSIGTDSIFFWGMRNNLWYISFFNNNKIKDLLSQKEPITNLIPLSKNTFVYSTTKEIILIQPDTLPLRILKSEVPIESFVFGNNGFIYLSLSNGIFKMGKEKSMEPVCLGVHGLLKSYRDFIFVLWQEKNCVVVLKEKE